MGGKRRGGGGGGPPERVRTHLLFSREHTQSTQKRKRRPHNKLQHTNVHKKDEMVQAGAGLLDPTEWTGNQRVLHYGPMAQRDPYFYYYPKGWDILYPATFGFFPYRTTRFRGSHSTVCVGAFGVFLLFGGAFMVFLGYFWLKVLQIVGPVFLILGAILCSLACCLSLTNSDFFKTYLHHTKQHEEPSKLTTITTIYRDPEPYFEKDPYQPLPPPAYPVLANKYAHSNVVKPHDELKLYPPVIPGCSTLSLHGRSPSHLLVGSPYNTLRVYGTQSQRYQAGNGAETTSERRRVGSIVTNKKTNSEQKRSKSAGPLPRSGSNRSTRSQRPRERENSQI
ncbi:unnamed protein product, partial [Mesorhabditis belari]|uniref:Uncharacterized protein n=1 Tax=Mesorhabditis belari TaxID=2138241 RepID=A0AAF3FMT9_9BILA